MKKVLLLLTLLAIVVALVACGETKPPIDDEPAVTTKAPTTTAPAATKFTVKFMDSELFLEEGAQKLLSEQSVARGKFARAPRDPEHEGYVFVGWDIDDYSNVTSDMTITAMYRPVDTYTVEFYNGETLLSTVTVKEGEAAEEPETPLKVGYIFSGWDKPVARVDREWSDFAQYADLSEEELAATTMVFKTEATFEEGDSIIKYVNDVTFDLVETTVDGKKVFLPANNEYFTEPLPYIELNSKNQDGSGLDQIPLEEKYNMVDANMSFVWDGEYIYIYAVIEDPTLLTRGYEYCYANAVPWQNDSFEFWYTLGEKPTRQNVKLFMLDFYGYRLTSDGEGGNEGVIEMSKHFENIEYKCEVVEETNTSYMLFKLPAIDEYDQKLVPGNVLYYAIQIDDLRAVNGDEAILRAGTSNRYAFNEYEMYTLGEPKE